MSAPFVATADGVKVLGFKNWPGRIPIAASSLYAKNLLTFLTTFWDKDGKVPKLPEDDAIVQGVMITRDGAVVHKQFASEAVRQPTTGSVQPAGAAEEDAAPSMADPAADVSHAAADLTGSVSAPALGTKASDDTAGTTVERATSGRPVKDGGETGVNTSSNVPEKGKTDAS